LVIDRDMQRLNYYVRFGIDKSNASLKLQGVIHLTWTVGELERTVNRNISE